LNDAALIPVKEIPSFKSSFGIKINRTLKNICEQYYSFYKDGISALHRQEGICDVLNQIEIW
jgi:hypothetical protein